MVIAALALAAADVPYNPPTFPETAVVDKDRECVRKWRGRAMLAHAADTATTVAAIETGRGREGNPLARLTFGKNVTSGEFVAFKLGMIGLQEGVNALALTKGDYAGVCRNYRITAFVIGGVAMLNLRVHF